MRILFPCFLPYLVESSPHLLAQLVVQHQEIALSRVLQRPPQHCQLWHLLIQMLLLHVSIEKGCCERGVRREAVVQVVEHRRQKDLHVELTLYTVDQVYLVEVAFLIKPLEGSVALKNEGESESPDFRMICNEMQHCT